MKGVQGRPVMAILGTADMDAALAFYADTLGLSVISSDAYGTSLEAGGTELRLTHVPTVVPTPYSQLAWRVSDLDTIVASLRDLGVQMVRFDHLEQDEMGAWTGPGGVRVVWFHDPDRNLLSLLEDLQR
jgi:catechol 2,3-dioxygenase-like lactoylglutathione lyase family enzyme